VPGSPGSSETNGWAVRWIGAQRDVLGGDVSGKADTAYAVVKASDVMIGKD